MQQLNELNQLNFTKMKLEPGKKVPLAEAHDISGSIAENEPHQHNHQSIYRS